MTSWLRRKFVLPIGIILIALAGLVLANLQGVLFAIAILTGAGRPALLSDAHWKQPSARFRAHCPPGTPETELRQWLAYNRFVIEQPGVARRLIESLPCSEGIEVTWTAHGGRLATASATVEEAGCL